MENFKDLKLNLSGDDAKKIVMMFKEKNLDENMQNLFIESLFIKQAKAQGFSDKQINLMRDVLHGIEFDISKSELLYKIRSTSMLQHKVDMAKDKINHLLEKEAISKTQNQNKNVQGINKKSPFQIKIDSAFISKLCRTPKASHKTLVNEELRRQGLSDGDLNNKIKRISHSIPPSPPVLKDINPPISLAEYVLKSLEESIYSAAKKPNAKSNFLSIINNPQNASNPELKTFVLCHLKEATEKEFKEYINNPALRGFLGEQEFKEVVSARKMDAAFQGKLKPNNYKEKPKNTKKPEENKPKEEKTELEKLDEELMDMLGITEPIGSDELHNLAEEYGLVKSNKK